MKDRLRQLRAEVEQGRASSRSVESPDATELCRLVQIFDRAEDTGWAYPTRLDRRRPRVAQRPEQATPNPVATPAFAPYSHRMATKIDAGSAPSSDIRSCSCPISDPFPHASPSTSLSRRVPQHSEPFSS